MNDFRRSLSLPSPRRLVVCLSAALGLNLPGHGIASPQPVAIAALAVTGESPALATRFVRPTAPDGDEIVVANCNDSGPGSLRDVIAGAGNDATIDLTSLTCSTITLTSGAIAIAQYTLNLRGPGAAALTIDGNNSDRVLDHTGGGFLDIYALALAHGSGTGDGGCIRSSGGVALSSSRVEACHAYASGEARGGAIYAYAVLLDSTLVTDSQVESDTAYARGGGVYAHYFAPTYSTISNNLALSHASHSFGGGAYVTLRLFMRNATVSGNVASISAGLGVHTAGIGNAHIVDSTVSGNTATVFMGGVFTDSPLQLYNTTIAFNCAATTEVNASYIAGIGLHFRSTAPYIESSIIANNTICGAGAASANDLPYDISGHLYNGAIEGAHNLVVTAAATLPAGTLRSDPLLGPLQNNGGPTPTHALLPGSPAIDAGDNVTQTATDQRGNGYDRIVGMAADIGAFEVQPDLIFFDGFDPD